MRRIATDGDDAGLYVAIEDQRIFERRPHSKDHLCIASGEVHAIVR